MSQTRTLYKFSGQSPRTETMEELMDDMVFPLLAQRYIPPEDEALRQRQWCFIRQAAELAAFWRMGMELEQTGGSVEATFPLVAIGFRDEMLRQLRKLMALCDEVLLIEPVGGYPMRLILRAGSGNG